MCEQQLELPFPTEHCGDCGTEWELHELETHEGVLYCYSCNPDNECEQCQQHYFMCLCD